jgi:hypothetical protein
MAFTFNTRMQRGRKHKSDKITARWAAEEEQFLRTAKRLKVDPARVVYLGTGADEKRLFVPESPELVRQFVKHYEDVFKQYKPTVFHDNRNAFFPKGKCIFDELGLQKHHEYPAAVHHHLSVNDNCLHGTAKRPWRRDRAVFGNDGVLSTLTLMRYLDRDIVKPSVVSFKKNMVDLDEKGAWEMIRGGKGAVAAKTEERLWAYRVFVGQNGLGEQPDTPVKLRSGLDGRGWKRAGVSRRL